MRNELVKLVISTAEDSEISIEEIEVFAEKKSVARTEFYASYQKGLNPKYIFKLDSLDYDMTRRVDDYGVESFAQELIYNNAKFTIIRTYDNGSEIELTVG